MFKLALIQMHVDGGKPAQNITRASLLIEEAIANHAKVIVLPEVMDVGWTHPDTRELAEEIPNGRTCKMLRDAAREHGVYICSGLAERDGKHIYNSAVLIDPHGEVVLLYRKLNELEIGHECYDLGDRLGVVDTPYGRFGLMICADGFACDQVLSRSLGYMGAQVILSPSAWARPADHDNKLDPYGKIWRDNYGPPAKDFGMWIIGVSNVGRIEGGAWDGRNCIGCSLVIGPDGKQVLQGPYGVDAETILYVDIKPQPRPARGTLWAERWKK